MYRAVAWKALDSGLPLDDEAAVADLARRATICAIDGVVTIDGLDIAQKIRNAEIDGAAARVARLPKVREVLVKLQKQEGARGGLVVEGRDIGTVVFPDADVKVFLDASPSERARRRATDPAHSNRPGQVEDVLTAMDERDRLDRTRAASPLYEAADARRIDTTGKTIDQVVADVMTLVRARLAS